MKIPVKYLIFISLFISLLSSCKKGGTTGPNPAIKDTTKPTITIVKPTAGQVFVAGNTISFQATFADNEKLKSYDIVISQKLVSGLILKIVPTSVPYSYTKSSTSLSSVSKSQEITLNDITIPSNTATNIVTPGKYNCKVTCLDASNNTAETILEFTIN